MACLALFDLAMEEGAQPQAGADCCLPEVPGSIVAGRYVLKTVLGEGASGWVWRAEQTAPMRREVALKIMHHRLKGVAVSSRFNREHQVLARVEHPNIAAVFDAGETADGRTFFAMELVDGLPITQWCCQNETPVRARLEIFLQACQAVQHAHQKGILHRDLKPSNVLVTLSSGRPLVKVIDFGIAKALSADLDGVPDRTLRGMVLGTPRYMSPEQAGLTGEDVDTRTDVFALGVLLYELLTGTTPISADDAETVALPELLHRVRHAETERPSRRVTRVASAAMPPAAAPRRLARQLDGDLDWIILKALQHDREKRYPAVSALAEDVQRHLNDEAVSAGPPSAVYRLAKWSRRHRGMLTGALAVLCVALAGVAATWWALDREQQQRQEAERQRLLAQEQAETAEKISAQLGELLVNARRHVNAGMNTAILRQIADECAAGMPRFADDPQIAARLAWQLASLYEGLEEPVPAMRWFQRHWELMRQTEGPRAEATLQALYELGWRGVDHSMAAQAVDWLREAAEGFEQMPGRAEAALAARKEQARGLSRAGRHDEAARLFAEVMEKGGADQPKAAIWLRQQADALRGAGRLEEARQVLEKAMAKVRPDDAATRAYVLSSLADVNLLKLDWEAALDASAQHIKALDSQEDRPPHAHLLNALIQHAFLACKCPGCPGGEQAARRALAMAKASGHETRLADAWTAWSEVLRVTRRFRESEEAVRQAIEELAATKAERWRVLELHRRLGDLLVERGNFEEALTEYQTAAQDLLNQNGSLQGPRDKKKLIFSSFIIFWERALKAQSPVADERQLAEWRARYATWQEGQKTLP